MSLRISLAQMNVVLGEPQTNLETVRLMAAEAARRGSQMLVLPELWSTGYDLENAANYATTTDDGIFAEVAEMAVHHRLHVLGSCLSLLGPGQYGNTAVLFNPGGEVLGSYSKIHLFRLMQEEQYLTAGDHLALVDSEWGPLGLAICYDLRFPEMFRCYALEGARVVFLPSEWPHPRLAHWQTLLRARAIENQFYMVACNRVGRSKETDFFGHSCIVDPWGQTLIEAGEEEMLLTCELDLGRVEAVRQKIPIFEDRRPDLYR
ncbi:MAG TPA: carbon-nitrogen family hydrolase [Candidatus Binatia bacterium]|nr:carbon-nitrogen family hydrolase [Candidatus Binatia bacterium]